MPIEHAIGVGTAWAITTASGALHVLRPTPPSGLHGSVADAAPVSGRERRLNRVSAGPPRPVVEKGERARAREPLGDLWPAFWAQLIYQVPAALRELIQAQSPHATMPVPRAGSAK